MTENPSSSASPSRSSGVLVGLIAILIAYGAAATAGLPQRATEQIVAASGHAEVDHDAHAEEQAVPVPATWIVFPFVLLLGAIAVFPLMHATEHWWDNNLHKFYVSLVLGVITLVYYMILYQQPLDRHFLGHAVIEPQGSFALNIGWTVIQNAIFNDFVPFIILLFSLYTISGGIRIQGDLAAHPITNTAFMAVGSLLASFIGTTGAAMLLIRPLIETNNERKHVAHTIVFFIFIVCNCGGCLLPLGDPPLFLGYLQGVDFLWTLNLWPAWLITNGLLLVAYFFWDTLFAYPKETKKDVVRDETRTHRLRFFGVWPNALLLLGIVLAVAFLDPSKTVPGTDWHPWLYLREVVLLGLVALSLFLGSRDVREANKFSYGAIVEVGALFIGIFICMQPALQILRANGASLGIDTPTKFFWATGSLSSVLDNAPTYLVFFEAAKPMTAKLSLAPNELMQGVSVYFLEAISLGAVFMGAMTYIGNGPNFMVKTIAERSDIKMPSFFGYMLYSFGVLFPILILMTLIVL